MSTARSIYRVVRSILFTAISLVAALYLFLYVSLSVPYVQNRIAREVEKELSALTGGKVEIGHIEIFPFNEAVVSDVRIADAEGRECIAVDKIGAGIDLTSLIFKKRVIITYAEVMGLDARVTQSSPDSPLNIQFLIDAFAPKEKNKPPTKFDLALHSVVIRNCKASLDREWIPRRNDGSMDFNHIYIRDLNADVDIPRLSNEDYLIDIRRLSLEGPSGLKLNTLSLKAHITPASISIRDFILKMPGSDIRPADIALTFPSFSEIGKSLYDSDLRLVLIDSRITPADFSSLFPPLSSLGSPYLLSLDLKGNLTNIDIDDFKLRSENTDEISLTLEGNVAGLTNPKEKGEAKVRSLRLETEGSFVETVVSAFVSLPTKAREILDAAGQISLNLTGDYSVENQYAAADMELMSSSCGQIDLMCDINDLGSQALALKGKANGRDIDLGFLLGKEYFGETTFEAEANGRIGKGILDGEASLNILSAFFKGKEFKDVLASVSKKGSLVSGELSSNDSDMSLDVSGEANIDGNSSHLSVQADVKRFIPSVLGIIPQYSGYSFKGDIVADVSGNSLDNITGFIRGRNLTFSSPDKVKKLYLSGFDLEAVPSSENTADRSIELKSDYLDMNIEGNYSLKSFPGEMKCLLSHIIPSFISPDHYPEMASRGKFNIDIRPCDNLLEFFSAPVRILVPFSVYGNFDMHEMVAEAYLSAPYLQQGRDKLVRDTQLALALSGNTGRGSLTIHTLYPSKKGDAELDLIVSAISGDINADIGWKIEQMNGFAGTLSLTADTGHEYISGRDSFTLKVNPTNFSLSGADWQIGESLIEYNDKSLLIDDFKVWHDGQFISINGAASASPSDILEISLADIDLGFIFDTLNINYVTFGGIATGEIAASSIFSSTPVAATRSLDVKDLSYNDCVIGDGAISSRWNNEEKEVEIKADIKSDNRRVAALDGGIWVTADSLNFKIDADKVNIGFLKPFMAAFTSDVGGRASGWANLYGNFHDIDLKGRLFADSIGIKLDYTNVYYHGSDSVRIDPGQIHIPGFRIYDHYGNSAVFSGDLSHRYFHDPRFEFKISEAKDLLCYDTNPSINPVWYGRVFGNGGGVLRGWPGGVTIDIDMATAKDSEFSFVISDEQEVGEYNFLTFTDSRKESMKQEERDTVPEIVKMFRKKVEQSLDLPSLFSLNLFATITPDALLTIVMDPRSGDKITARGSGPMQVNYDSETDNFAMYGRYTLEEGKYNFILQDLILRDFDIRPGSSIAFNGDPLRANLDIQAAYRVNTNLSDLDESFSHDPELNRTNVPVDAMLAISGEMDHPDISFDIELPTLTSDVARKVKSIVSTDDMMNRQVLYLLALNRFYTPEYMGASGNGGELASVASSTLSSQLSRIVGQITDKVTLAPSFRSDKGDFSDFEMDLALSSRLLDNRLLLNGNFGYRDRTASSTTFIGDFDIEYLLNRSGNLRLKAFNHFNDQNYYLKSSLTTQGIGVAYRWDFDNIFTFLGRRRKKSPIVLNDDTPPTPTDSTENNAEPKERVKESMDSSYIEIQ